MKNEKCLLDEQLKRKTQESKELGQELGEMKSVFEKLGVIRLGPAARATLPQKRIVFYQQKQVFRTTDSKTPPAALCTPHHSFQFHKLTRPQDVRNVLNRMQNQNVVNLNGGEG